VLGEIAATKGLAGMALLDTAPPGYSLPASNRMYSAGDYGAEVGYTPAARIAFIRSGGYDPIDLASGTNYGNVDLRLPFFADDERYRYGIEPFNQNAAELDSAGQWNRFRSQMISKVLTELHAPLKSSVQNQEGTFPVYLQNLDAATGAYGWFSQWEKADALPRRADPQPGKTQNAFEDARSASKVSLVDMGYRDYPPSAREAAGTSPVPPIAPSVQYARFVNSLLNYNKGAWSGMVLNFSEVSVDRALELLKGIVPAEKAPLQRPLSPAKADKSDKAKRF
jgi:hypothetical protein